MRARHHRYRYVTRNRDALTLVHIAEVPFLGERLIMPDKRKHPAEETSKKEALKNSNPNTRGKNFAGQTNGQWEQDPKRGAGQFNQAGEPPLMKK